MEIAMTDDQVFIVCIAIVAAAWIIGNACSAKCDK